MKQLSFVLIFAFLCAKVDGQFSAAQSQANSDLSTFGVSYNADRNIYIDRQNTIHIFLYEDGNLLLGGYPSTATDRNKYRVHLYKRSANTDNFLLDYAGTYTPTLNMPSANALVVNPITRLDFAILGPFTNSLQLTLKSQPAAGGSYTNVAITTIKIAKTIHASIGSGFLYTSLKNPSNIRKVPIIGGNDSTLLADDAEGKGILTLMATFYPWGRNNLMLASEDFKDRCGVVVGTTIGSGTSNFRDIIFGLQYDFTIGGSLVVGGHYGRRQKIDGVSYKDFDFGKTKFSGDLQPRLHNGWDLGFVIGLQADTRIFS